MGCNGLLWDIRKMIWGFITLVCGVNENTSDFPFYFHYAVPRLEN